MLVDCQNVDKMSLIPWKEFRDCHDSPPPPPLVSARVRRSYYQTQDSSDPSGERIEGLELELKKMKRRLARAYKLMTRISAKQKHYKPETDMKSAEFSASSVCIDHQGLIKEENEMWIHSESKPGGSCAHCVCKNYQIRCQKAAAC